MNLMNMRHMKYLEKEVLILKRLQLNIINLKCVHASLLSDKSFNITFVQISFENYDYVNLKLLERAK